VFVEDYKPQSSLLWNFLQLPVISTLLGTNNVFSTLFLNTLSIRTSLSQCWKQNSTSIQNSQNYNCIYIDSPNLTCSLHFFMHVVLIGVIPKCFNFATFWKNLCCDFCWWSMNTYSVLSAFTSRPISLLLLTNNFCGLFYCTAIPWLTVITRQTQVSTKISLRMFLFKLLYKCQ